MDEALSRETVDLWPVRGRLPTNMPGNFTVSNHTVSDTHYNFPALIFGILLTIVIICGNVLVCLSVYTENALKTTTNYFIVSLAVADLLLAILVLPLFVYAEVSFLKLFSFLSNTYYTKFGTCAFLLLQPLQIMI